MAQACAHAQTLVEFCPHTNSQPPHNTNKDRHIPNEMDNHLWIGCEQARKTSGKGFFLVFLVLYLACVCHLTLHQPRLSFCAFSHVHMFSTSTPVKSLVYSSSDYSAMCEHANLMHSGLGGGLGINCWPIGHNIPEIGLLRRLEFFSSAKSCRYVANPKLGCCFAWSFLSSATSCQYVARDVC